MTAGWCSGALSALLRQVDLGSLNTYPIWDGKKLARTCEIPRTTISAMISHYGTTKSCSESHEFFVWCKWNLNDNWIILVKIPDSWILIRRERQAVYSFVFHVGVDYHEEIKWVYTSLSKPLLTIAYSPIFMSSYPLQSLACIKFPTHYHCFLNFFSISPIWRLKAHADVYEL